MNQQTKWQASLEALCQNSSGQVTLSFYDEKLRHGFSVGGSCAVLSASTIKLLVLAEVFRQAEEGSLSLAEGVTLTAEKRTGGDGILKELLSGHTFTLKELCTLMIIVSDNEAANLLLDRVGMDKVNQLGEDLGLTATHLGRKMMDSAARDAGLRRRPGASSPGHLRRHSGKSPRKQNHAGNAQAAAAGGPAPAVPAGRRAPGPQMRGPQGRGK